MRSVALVGLVLGLGVCAFRAEALTIASYTESLNLSGSANGRATGIRFDMCLTVRFDSRCQFLFGGTSFSTSGLVLTEADVGRTFLADEHAPGFAIAEQFLTNGVNDNFGLLYGIAPTSGGSGLFQPEENLFAFLGGVDLEGFDLTAIAITILDLDLTLSFSNAFSQGSVRIDFLGDPVPEPASVVLLGSGLAWFALRPRRDQGATARAAE